MTRYRSGTDFEREVRAVLIRDGYDLVVRSAGSKTKVDLIAIKPGQVLFIQCKRNGICPPAERIALVRVASMLPGVGVPVVASRPGVTFVRLTGVRPRDRVAWTTDEVG